MPGQEQGNSRQAKRPSSSSNIWSGEESNPRYAQRPSSMLNICSGAVHTRGRNRNLPLVQISGLEQSYLRH